MSVRQAVVLPSAILLALSLHAGDTFADTAAAPAQGTASAGSLDATLIALDRSAYDAWKTRNAKFWDTFLADGFAGWGAVGRLDKAAAKKEYTGADCEIKSFGLSNGQARLLGKGVALITYVASVDGSCAGQKVPADSRAASVYVRDGARWKGAFHAGDTIVDPKAAPASSAGTIKVEANDTDLTERDARTNAMLAVEKRLWEAWRLHDAEKMAAEMAREISFVDIFGTYFPTKAEGLKAWSGSAAGCDVSHIAFTDAAGRMLSPTVGFITFKAQADGTCFGQKIGPIWSSSFYVKDGDAWKWTFGINIPGRVHRG
ncbi:MAG: nuclear transport factor 2 family protein [Proteobacteria bacterium]|nr:nuclear transport factor 2 family protein [Pseudomonadota bacterium]